jgi:hypothetical protein
MSYTATQINKMSIEDIESLAEMLSSEELSKWTSSGYEGDCFVEIIKNR